MPLTACPERELRTERSWYDFDLELEATVLRCGATPSRPLSKASMKAFIKGTQVAIMLKVTTTTLLSVTGSASKDQLGIPRADWRRAMRVMEAAIELVFFGQVLVYA